MIKQIYVCECDICGAVVTAKAKSYRNETDYVMPDNWTHGKNSKICICPACSEKLSGSKPAPTPTYISNAEAVPVYGCPAVTSDDPHIVYFSDGSRGIIQEITDVKTATNSTEITIDEIADTSLNS